MAVAVRCSVNSTADQALRKRFRLQGNYALSGERGQLSAYLRISPEVVSLPFVAGLDFAAERKLAPITNNRVRPLTAEAKFTPRPYQESAFAWLAGQLTDAEPAHMAVLPPGWGKTLYGGAAIGQVKLRTLILTDLQALLPSWTSVIHRVLPGLRLWVVGVGEPDLEADVILCMATRIGQVPGAVLLTIGLLIVDEAHRFCTANRVDMLLRIPVVRLLLLSGTPDRADGLSGVLDLLTGGNRIERAVPAYTVYKVNTGCRYAVRKKEMFVKATGRYQKVNDFDGYVKDVAADPERRKIVVDLVANHLAGRKIIVLCRSVANCKALYTALVEAGVSADYMTGTRKKYNDSRVLLGTGSKIGTGFDEANACEDFGGVVSDTLIIADSIKDSSALLQWIGRILRSDKPEVYQLIDDHPIAEKHWKQNLKMHVDLNQTVRECDYPADFSVWVDPAVRAEIGAGLGPVLPRDLVKYMLAAV